MSLVDMSLSMEEKKEMAEPTAITDRPDFPFGLRIHLDPDAVEKLGLSEMPSVDDKMPLMAAVEVVEVSSNKGEDDRRKHSMTLQITAMKLGEMDESEDKSQEQPRQSAAETLFGG